MSYSAGGVPSSTTRLAMLRRANSGHATTTTAVSSCEGTLRVTIVVSAMLPSGLHSDAVSVFGSALSTIKMVEGGFESGQANAHRHYLSVEPKNVAEGPREAERRQGMGVGRVGRSAPPHFGARGGAVT